MVQCYEATIKQHEEFAIFALISLIILGLISILGIFQTIKKPLLTRSIAFVILFISVISFGLVARTGYLGGQIRHTELNSKTTENPTQQEKVDDED